LLVVACDSLVIAGDNKEVEATPTKTLAQQPSEENARAIEEFHRQNAEREKAWIKRQQRVLDRPIAKELLSSSEQFKISPGLRLCTGPCTSAREYQYLGAFEQILVDLGYLSLQAQYPASYLSLTAKGQQEAKGWRAYKDEGWCARCTYYNIPLSHSRTLTITGIQSQGSTAIVEFNWDSSSPTPIGEAVLKSGKLRLPSGTGKAYLQLYDDGWRVGDVKLGGGVGTGKNLLGELLGEE